MNDLLNNTIKPKNIEELYYRILVIVEKLWLLFTAEKIEKIKLYLFYFYYKRKKGKSKTYLFKVKSIKIISGGKYGIKLSKFL